MRDRKQALIFEERDNGELLQTMQQFMQQVQKQRAVKAETRTTKNSKKHRFEATVNKVVFKVCNSHPIMNRVGFALGEHIDLFKPNGMKVYVDIIIRKPSQMAYCPIFNMHAGPIVQKGHQKANSFVQNFLILLAYDMNNFGGALTCIDVTNTSQTMGAGVTNIFSTLGPSNSSTQAGIYVGTSTTIAAATDYNMGTQVATGTSAGQLQYQADTQNLAATSSNTVTATHTRQFVNNSGASITIKEVGMAWLKQNSAAATKYFLILHDNLGANYTIVNTSSATVTYTFSTTT